MDAFPCPDGAQLKWPHGPGEATRVMMTGLTPLTTAPSPPTCFHAPAPAAAREIGHIYSHHHEMFNQFTFYQAVKNTGIRWDGKTTFVCMHNVRCLQDTKIKIGRRAGAGCAAGRTNEGSAGPAPRTNHRPRLRCAPGGAQSSEHGAAAGRRGPELSSTSSFGDAVVSYGYGFK